MAQIPKVGLVKGPYKSICRNCAINFSITVPTQETQVQFLVNNLDAVLVTVVIKGLE